MRQDAPAPPRLSRRSQGLTPVEQVLRYHRETKHQFLQYARSLGFLDWANQPDPFRRYAGAPLYPLPVLPPEADRSPLYDDLYVPGRITPRPVTLDSLSRFLEYALSITAWKQAGEVRWALRSNPSSGNLHPTEGYVLVRPMAGLASDAGVYHYAPKEHGLEQRALIPRNLADQLWEELPPESFLFGLTSIYWREAWKYGERAFRYCHHDVGHALGSARMAAAAVGWRLVVLDGLSDAQVSALLGVCRREDVDGAEPEHADCLALVWPEGSSPGGLETFPLRLASWSETDWAGLQWYGKANRLSPEDPLIWDIVDEVAEATRSPGRHATATPTITSSAGDIEGLPARPVTAHHIFHQRRSAVAFDGKTSIPVAQFFFMLSRVMPRWAGGKGPTSPPWDCWPRPPRIHLALFVHLVDGLTPGLYCLVRDDTKLPALKESMNPAFTWEKPPGCPFSLPLYVLAEGDARRLAAQLSCHQDIAGASAFSLGMLAEFDAPLREHGPALYPRFFWECGMIGQVLYLEAEAAGLRATGIGCFFDDPVHEVLGVRDARFQSLYHFTIGEAVEDTRLTTLPPYDHLRRS